MASSVKSWNARGLLSNFASIGSILRIGNSPLALVFAKEGICRCHSSGSSINDVSKIFRFLPIPPCLYLELIYAIKFTQPPLLHPLFHDTPPPTMWTSYLEAPKNTTCGQMLPQKSQGVHLLLSALAKYTQGTTSLCTLRKDEIARAQNGEGRSEVIAAKTYLSLGRRASSVSVIYQGGAKGSKKCHK